MAKARERSGATRARKIEDELRAWLDRMIGKPLLGIGRAADLLWLAIGEPRTAVRPGAADRRVGELALHVQAPFRMIDDASGKLAFGRGDMFCPRSDREWREELDCFMPGTTLLDERIEGWVSLLGPVTIERYELNGLGDLGIAFSGGHVLEVRVHTTDGSEAWRLFGPDSRTRHLVVYGKEPDSVPSGASKKRRR